MSQKGESEFSRQVLSNFPRMFLRYLTTQKAEKDAFQLMFTNPAQPWHIIPTDITKTSLFQNQVFNSKKLAGAQWAETQAALSKEQPTEGGVGEAQV